MIYVFQKHMLKLQVFFNLLKYVFLLPILYARKSYWLLKKLLYSTKCLAVIYYVIVLVKIVTQSWHLKKKKEDKHQTSMLFWTYMIFTTIFYKASSWLNALNNIIHIKLLFYIYLIVLKLLNFLILVALFFVWQICCSLLYFE